MNKKILSFCIPNYNRLDHLKKTLAVNLTDNKKDEEDVEFILIDFSGECESWVVDNFAAELNSGYLKYFQRDLGGAWHFGRAKSFFKEIITSKIYSSLDGDNYTGYRGGKHIIDVFLQYDFQCVFHQFSGVWRDGSCGRISLPVRIYQSFAYDTLFFPRGYDELDCVLSVITNNPNLYYLHYDTGEIALWKCPLTSQFLDENRIQVRAKIVPKDITIKKPEFPKVDQPESQMERFFNLCNMYMSFVKNAANIGQKARYEKLFFDQQIQAKYCPEIDLVDTVLGQVTGREPLIREDDIILCCVLKDAEFYLESFLQHYRKIGVTKFFLVDNNSETPISSTDKDIFIWRTKVGYFKYFKIFWIDLLLERYAKENWCLTVDVDEFLVYEGYENENLRALTAKMKKQKFLPSILLDLYSKDYRSDSKENFRENCVYYDWWQGIDSEYNKFSSCKWAYGESSDWFRRIDIRRRVFGTIDCLRKIPLFKYSKKLFFNQGFHDLLMEGKWCWIPKDKSLLLHPRRYFRLYRESKLKKESLVETDVFQDPQKKCGILLHYKFVSCFPEQLKRAYESKQYFERTSNNQKIMLDKMIVTKSLYKEGVSKKITDSHSLPYPNKTKSI